MTAGPRAAEHLGPAGEAEWARLRRHLELAGGFWLGFVFTPSPFAAAVLRRRTELHVRTLRLLQPEDPDELRVVWRELHWTAAREAGCVWVEAVRADPPTQPHGPWTTAWEALFLALNEQREILRRTLSGGLVLVTIPELKPRARELASDLWSIRSLVVDVPGVASERPEAWPEIDWIPRGETRSGAGRRGLALTPAAGSVGLRGLLRSVAVRLALGATGKAVEAGKTAVASATLPAGVAVALTWLSRAEEAHDDLTAAADHVEEALRVADETVDRSTVNELLDRAGRLAERRGDLRRAATAYREAALSVEDETTEALRERAAALDALSHVSYLAGYSATAAAAEAVSLRRRLAERSPDDPEALRGLSRSLRRAAGYRSAAGDFGAAAALLDDRSLWRRLAESAGRDPQTCRELAWGLWSLGDARRGLSDLAGARAAYDEALTLSRRLAETAGEDPEGLVATSLERLGDLHSESGDTPAAIAAYEEAIRALGADRFRQLGRLHHKLGNIDATIAAYEQAVEAGRSGREPWDLRVLAALLDDLGAARSEAGDLAGAGEAFEQRLDLERRLFDWYQATPRAIRSLIGALTAVASARRAAGDTTGADDAEQEAAQLREPG